MASSEGKEPTTDVDVTPKKPMRWAKFGPELDDHPKQDGVVRLGRFVYDLFDAPVTWIRENIVLPNKKKTPYYHRRYHRVPTIDECYFDDGVCLFEATEQYMRDREVEERIVSILKSRWQKCLSWYNGFELEKCDDLNDDFRQAEMNFFIKHGNLMYPPRTVDVYMKQKHRMIWERRNGPLRVWKGGEFIKTKDKQWGGTEFEIPYRYEKDFKFFWKSS